MQNPEEDPSRQNEPLTEQERIMMVLRLRLAAVRESEQEIEEAPGEMRHVMEIAFDI